MKISASIYADKQRGLETVIPLLDAHHIDFFHVDCNDDARVFDDIKAIRRISATAIDLHIISPRPASYLTQIADTGVEYVCFQYEGADEIPAKPQGSSAKFGLAITTSTPITVFDKATGYDFIMLMATTPGQSGGKFDVSNFKRIIEFKQRYPGVKVHVDGGVNDEIAYILRVLGVDTIISGSYLMNQEWLGAGLTGLHKSPNKESSTFLVNDFATPLSYLPVINQSEVTFLKALQVIEQYKQGFVMVVDDSNRLTGIISNADVRKAILKHSGNTTNINATDIINTRPISISSTASLYDMLKMLNNLPFIVLFLPVTGAGGELTGAVLLNNLTRF